MTISSFSETLMLNFFTTLHRVFIYFLRSASSIVVAALEKAKFTFGNGISKTFFQIIFVFKDQDFTAFDSVRFLSKYILPNNKDISITSAAYFYYYNDISPFHLAPNRTI